MKKIERVLLEILYRVYERGELFMSQTSLAQACGVSMDSASRVATRLEQFKAIERKPFGFRVIDARKILLYWACTRSLRRDLAYSTYSPDSTQEIEDGMPPGAIFTAYSGYRKKFSSEPAYCEEVWVYADPEEVKRRFQEREVERENVFVLRPDPHLKRVSEGGVPPLAQIYVDLWQIGGATADRYITALEQVFEAKGVEALKILARRGNSSATF